MYTIIKAFWLIAIDGRWKRSIGECVYNIILADFQVKVCCNSHKSSEYSDNKGSSMSIFNSSLKIASNTDASFVLEKIAFIVKLVFEYPYKRKDFQLRGIQFLKGTTLIGVLSFDSVQFFPACSEVSLFMAIRKLHKVVPVLWFWRKLRAVNSHFGKQRGSDKGMPVGSNGVS